MTFLRTVIFLYAVLFPTVPHRILDTVHMIYDVHDTVFYAFMRHSWSLAILRDGSLGDTMQLSLVAQSLVHSLFVATPLRHWLCVSRDHAHTLYLAAVRCHSGIANAMREPRLPRGRSTSHIQPIAGGGICNSLAMSARRMLYEPVVKRIVTAVESEHVRVRNAIANDSLCQYFGATKRKRVSVVFGFCKS